MSDVTAADFLKLVDARRGHFKLESGHHSALWLDLDSLFAEPKRIEPFVSALAAGLQPHDVSVVCGPLLGGAFLAQLLSDRLGAQFCFTEREMLDNGDGLYRARYRLPPALARHVRGQRVAIVDDVMSAGSALRGTYAELRDHGAVPVVAGALLVLGTVGVEFFTANEVAVEAVDCEDYELWLPDECPLCAKGIPIG